MLPIAVFAISACWSLSADLDDLAGSSSNTSPLDAKTTGPDGTPIEQDGAPSSRDGNASTETGPNIDEDAYTGTIDTGGLPFCQAIGGTHTLCDDFDTGALGAKWDELDIGGTNGAAATLVSDNVKTTPNAMRVTLPGTCNEDSAQLLKGVAGPPGKVVVATDIAITSIPNTANILLVGFSYTTATGVYRADLSYGNERLVFIENDIGGTGYHPLGDTTALLPKDGVFRHIDLEITFTGATKKAIVRINNVQVGDFTLNPVAPAGGTQTRLDFGGYGNSNCSGVATDMRFDNLVYDFTAP